MDSKINSKSLEVKQRHLLVDEDGYMTLSLAGVRTMAPAQIHCVTSYISKPSDFAVERGFSQTVINDHHHCTRVLMRQRQIFDSIMLTSNKIKILQSHNSGYLPLK